jgi:hypothetical protein
MKLLKKNSTKEKEKRKEEEKPRGQRWMPRKKWHQILPTYTRLFF